MPNQPKPRIQQSMPFLMLLIEILAYGSFIAYYEFAPHGSGGFLSGLDLLIVFLLVWLIVGISSIIGIFFLNKWTVTNTYSNVKKQLVRFFLITLVTLPILLIGFYILVS